MSLRWQACRRFVREYEKASPPLQALAEQEVRHVQTVAVSRTDWMTKYDRLRGVSEPVLEFELGGGPRMLAHVGKGAATLLALGNHEITTAYSRRGNLGADLSKTQELPPAFVGANTGSFFPPFPTTAPGQLVPYWAERRPDWLYFLDDEQDAVCAGVMGSIEEVLADDEAYTVEFIIGGPGTGKTSLLLQLLKRLSDQVVANEETWRVGLRVSDPVAAYVAASTGWRLERSRELARHPDEIDVLLVDDPADDDEIASVVHDALRVGPLKAVVVAFDPLQLTESLSDAEYVEMAEEHDAGERRLHSSYRQKEAVGRHALGVATRVAASSPYLDAEKQRRYAKARRKLTNRANFVRFPNPSGHAVTHSPAKLDDWAAHLRWIRRQSLLWTHWPPLLVAVDKDTPLPEAWVEALDQCDVEYERIWLDDLQEIKGLEYQHVALVLSSVRHADLERGFSGSGRRLYNDYRLLRIPFTRAKDSVAVFVLDAVDRKPR